MSTHDTDTVMGTPIKRGLAPEAHSARETFKVVAVTRATALAIVFVTPSYVTMYEIPVTTPEHSHDVADVVKTESRALGKAVLVKPVVALTIVTLPPIEILTYPAGKLGAENGETPRLRLERRRTDESSSHVVGERAAAGRVHCVGGTVVRKRANKEGDEPQVPVGPAAGNAHHPDERERRMGEPDDMFVAAVTRSPGT